MTLNQEDKDGNRFDQVAIADAIPRPPKNVRGYMGKTWFDPLNGESTTRTVVCEGDIGADKFMAGKTYCP